MERETFVDELGVVVAAGGSSRRFGDSDKLFELIDKIPVFIRTLKNFIGTCAPGELVLVVPESKLDLYSDLVKLYLPAKNIKIVKGGDTRMKSVYNGLNALSVGLDYVAVTDAARPFASADMLFRCLEACKEHGGAITAKRMTDTVKKSDSDGFISKTVDRTTLWTVETPQVFSLPALRKAYEKAFADDKDFTDDAGVMEYSGHRVFLVDHTGLNMKITHPSDIISAEAYLKTTEAGIDPEYSEISSRFRIKK